MSPTKSIPFSLVVSRLDEIERLMQSLETERRVLNRLAAQAVDSNGNGNDVQADDAAPAPPAKLTSAVLEFVSKRPGAKTDQVVNDLAEAIGVHGPDKLRVIRNTVHNLLYRKRLVKNAEGGLHVDPRLEQQLFAK
jgi:hypothetical protein